MEHKELIRRLLDVKEDSSSKEEFEKKSKEVFPDVSETVLDIVWCAFEAVFSIFES